MGNTRYHTKDNGQSYAELEYDIWGNPTSPNMLINNDNGVFIFATFTGHIYDTVLDIYFAEARFYDAKNRQWMNSGPMKDGLNWYQYVRANPATWVDPFGCFSVTAEEMERAIADYSWWDMYDRELSLEEVDLVNYDPWLAAMLSRQFEYNWQGKHVDLDFLIKVTRISILLDINANDLMLLMYTESGIDPEAKNVDKYGNTVAAGLLQFANKDNFGYSREGILQLSALQQLDLVYEYFNALLCWKTGANRHDIVDLYSLMFLPGAGGFGQGDSFIIAALDGNNSWAYRGNPGLDKIGIINGVKKGSITRGDLRQHLNDRLKDFLNSKR